MTSRLSLNLGGYIHYVNCKGVEDIFKGVILFSYPPHHTEYFDSRSGVHTILVYDYDKKKLKKI